MKYIVVVTLAVCALLSWQALATEFPIVNMQAPSFDLPDLAGVQHSLNEYLGRPIVVNFWTTWCGACKYEFPVLEEFKQKYSDQVQLITICAGKSQEEALEAMEGKGADFIVLYDDEGDISGAYQPPRPRDKRRIVAYPFSVFIDVDGKVIYAKIGIFVDLDKIVSLLQEYGINLTEPIASSIDGERPVPHGQSENSK